jgi:hypothetical protein
LNKSIKIFKKGNLLLVLDRSQVFPNDPGEGCPALVSYQTKRDDYCSSYNCAINEECISGACGDKHLSKSQIDWLASLEDEVEDFLYGTK